MAEVDIFSIPCQTLFENTEHELCLFRPASYLEANSFLLSELSEEDVRASISSDHPSWQWKVIGHFGTKSESIILEPQTGKIYLYIWSRYPINQDFLADNLDDLLEGFQRLAPEVSVWDVT